MFNVFILIFVSKQLKSLIAEIHVLKNVVFWNVARCVDPGLTDVSEERIASIFSVENSASGEPASSGGCRLSHKSETTSYIITGKGECRPHGKSSPLADFSTLKMEADVPPKRRLTRRATSQKTTCFIVTAVKI
jgi:hypothetical protein